MLPFMLLVLVLSSVDPSPTPRNLEDAEHAVAADSLNPVLGFARDESSLNEMFREVEELMEDTQHKLKNAVDEMEVEAESPEEARPDVDLEKLPPNYHNESSVEAKAGNKTILTLQEIDKVTDNRTGSTIFSESLLTSVKGEEIKRNHECFIDEDCGTGKYCQITAFEYKCLQCKSQERCSRDAECCKDELCVWGFCTNGVLQGGNGTICERQENCSPGLCCAVQSDLLFPVCSPLPTEGERCHSPSNNLLEVITWGLESDSVLDRCPCATGLTCQTQSDDFIPLCQQSSLSDVIRSNEEAYEMEDLPLFSAIPIEAIDDFDKSKIIEAMNNELEDLEMDISDKTDVLEPEMPDLILEGDI
ncbi:dickkopf-related protein 3 [Ambystoma mexicanum]|uniref:dickkopf-related protein 3 n=1 Tax=Ambystoma mexicanum TaxID=8296 RepID=UPI0037E8C891